MKDLIDMGAGVTLLLLVWFIPTALALVLLAATGNLLLGIWAQYRFDKDREGRG